MEAIGEKICQLRKIRGISQEELAEYIGVSRQTIYKWESNQVQPNAENIKSLCDVFLVGVDYFYKFDQNKTNDQAIKDIAVSEYKKKSIKKYIVFIVLLSMFILICGALSIWFGFATFTDNIGDANVQNIVLPRHLFVFVIIFASIASVLDVLLIIRLMKIKKLKVNIMQTKVG